jgi:hypothetical protein
MAAMGTPKQSFEERQLKAEIGINRSLPQTRLIAENGQLLSARDPLIDCPITIEAKYKFWLNDPG